LRYCLFLISLSFGFVNPAAGTTYVINPDGTGDFPTIQTAIDMIKDGDIVELSNGVFTGDGNRDIDYFGKDIVVQSQAGDPLLCIVDCEGSESDPHRGFNFHTGESTNAEIEGITVRNGFAILGGAITFTFGTSPKVSNCIFEENISTSAEEGGGAIHCDGNPTLEGCSFTANSAGRGGAIFCAENAVLNLTNCLFEGNEGDLHAGAIYAFASRLTLTDCEFTENSSAGIGGAIGVGGGGPHYITRCTFTGNQSLEQGGGAYLRHAVFILSDCQFNSNSAADSGGGLSCEDDGILVIDLCAFRENTALVGGGAAVIFTEFSMSNCLFQENTADSDGGGLWCGSLPVPVIRDCTFYKNISGSEGGGIFTRREIDISRCSIVENQAPWGSGIAGYLEEESTITQCLIANGVEGQAIRFSSDADARLECCDLFGNEGGDWTADYADQLGTDGNICLDPLFCLNPDSDPTLASLSPCAPFTMPNTECDLIGNWPVGCQARQVQSDEAGDYPTIQDAVDAADDGDLIILADGIYMGEGNRDIDLQGKLIAIIPVPESSSPPVIDCEQMGRAFSCLNGEGPETKIERLIIRNGWADAGGALLLDGASPSIHLCTFWSNTATDVGGAISCRQGASPQISQCTARDNAAPSGGVIACQGGAYPAIDRSILSFSTQGQAVFCDSESGATLTCCDVFGNVGGDWQGCIFEQLGQDENLNLDPLYCGIDDFTLDGHSPCLPTNPYSAECGLIGAWSEGCLLQQEILLQPDGTGDYPSIQFAVDVSRDGDSILLADGTYSGDGNRDIEIIDKAITLRSVSGNPENCIIDAESTDDDRHRCIRLKNYDEEQRVTIDGITVTGGHAGGGGFRVSGTSIIQLSNCIIEGNRSFHEGAGVHSYATNVEFTNCIFRDNYAGDWGGGVIAFNDPQFVNCTFSGNYAEHGGGFYADDCMSTFHNCTFEDNISTRGGAVFLRYCDLTEFSECIFVNNSGSYGGAIRCEASSDIVVESCTFNENTGNLASHIDLSGSSEARISNSIISFGRLAQAVGCGSGNSVLTCCNVFGNEGGDWVDCLTDQLGGDGNISADPLFCYDFTPEQPLSLRLDSPCAPFTEPNPECDLIGTFPVSCGAVDVGDQEDIPETFYIKALQASPLVGVARLEYGIPAASDMENLALVVYDITGRVIERLDAGPLPAGVHTVTWNGKSAGGSRASAGIYFCRLHTGGRDPIARIVLLR
jgi:predicted outer membrane repeat protein